MILRISTCVIAILASPVAAAAQPPRVYIGGTLDWATQTEADTVPLGGTVVGGRALIGVHVSPRVSVEFEPSFAGSYSWEYRYQPTPSETADVVASRKNTFFTGQARLRFGVLEPVVGLSYVRGEISSHSTFYGDFRDSDKGLAAVGGLDVAIPVTSRVFLVPTIRLLATLPRGTSSGARPLDTDTGALLIRYGAGVRVDF